LARFSSVQKNKTAFLRESVKGTVWEKEPPNLGRVHEESQAV